LTSDDNASLWNASARERFDAAPLASEETVDLAVIGGGFTGCATALEAARMGASVLLLEAHRVAHGGSGRNVGLVNAGLWLPPETILRQMGEAEGKRLVEALAAGPQLTFDVIAREGIDCEPVRAGTLHLAHASSGLDDLRDRFRQGNRLGAPLQLLDDQEVARRTGSAAFHGALFDPRAGTVQPLSYCCGLARAAQEKGARLCERSPVTSVAYRHGSWHLVANGHTVRARALLMAMNAYHERLSTPLRPAFSTVHFSQYATGPLSEAERARILPGGEGCWDTALVMSSVRVDQSGRLILGGMGNADGPGARIHRDWARRKLRELYPDLAEVGFTHSWQGKIAMTSDHIPKVVQVGPGGYAVFGYSGRGIAPGTVFGTAAARALIEDRPDAFPLTVQGNYSERITMIKSAYYEMGATLTHAIDGLRNAGRGHRDAE
jgi:glycine/D-amino acid oxidase-like deaminating enzyme